MLNKTAFITGSNRGIGKCIAENFTQAGYHIIAHARNDSNEFKEFLSKLSEQYNVNCHPVFFDLSDYAQTKDCVAKLMKEKVKVDVLINNAGKMHAELFQMSPIDTIKDIFEVNLFSQMNLTQLVLRLMRGRESASIINLASIAGIDMHTGASAYGVSKAALIAWTKTLAVELASLKIRVNAIAPGLANTEMGLGVHEKAKEQFIENCTMKRLVEPEEIAKTVLFLASNDASFINGQILRVDGGQV